MNWYRVYHGMPSDSKWPIISKKSGQPIGIVVAVWIALLDHASQADTRGDVSTFDCEEIDALYGLKDGTTEAVYTALIDKKLIFDGHLTAWDRRQPLREDTGSETAMSSTERSRKCRAKQRSATQCNAPQRSATQCNAPQRSATQCNAPQRQDQIRTDQNRSEERRENTLPPTPSGGTGGGKIPFTEYTSDFNDWYDNYPSKIGKKPAFEAWRSLWSQGLLPPRDDLRNAVDRQKNHYGWDWPGREQFAPKPADWLLQRRWEDECPDTPYVPPQRDTAPPQRAQASSGGFDMERQRAINAQVLADLAEEENQKRLQEKTIEN